MAASLKSMRKSTKRSTNTRFSSRLLSTDRQPHSKNSRPISPTSFSLRQKRSPLNIRFDLARMRRALCGRQTTRLLRWRSLFGIEESSLMMWSRATMTMWRLIRKRRRVHYRHRHFSLKERELVRSAGALYWTFPAKTGTKAQTLNRKPISSFGETRTGCLRKTKSGRSLSPSTKDSSANMSELRSPTRSRSTRSHEIRRSLTRRSMTLIPPCSSRWNMQRMLKRSKIRRTSFGARPHP